MTPAATSLSADACPICCKASQPAPSLPKAGYIGWLSDLDRLEELLPALPTVRQSVALARIRRGGAEREAGTSARQDLDTGFQLLDGVPRWNDMWKAPSVGLFPVVSVSNRRSVRRHWTPPSDRGIAHLSGH